MNTVCCRIRAGVKVPVFHESEDHNREEGETYERGWVPFRL